MHDSLLQLLFLTISVILHVFSFFYKVEGLSAKICIYKHIMTYRLPALVLEKAVTTYFQVPCQNVYQVPCQNVYQVLCQNIVQVTSENVCQVPCQNVYQVPCQNIFQVPCQTSLKILYRLRRCIMLSILSIHDIIREDCIEYILFSWYSLQHEFLQLDIN